MATRVYATQDDILQDFVDRLIDRVPEMTRETCFVSDEPNPVKFPPSDLFMTVSPGDSTFDEAMFAGGGEVQITDDSSIVVSVFSRIQVDRRDWTFRAYLDSNRGVISKWKHAILRAILKDAWDPGDDSGPYLRDQVSPATAQAPVIATEGPETDLIYVRFTISFNVSFDWELG